MPRQNRVTPQGELIATPHRGTWMGNRGCLHDAQGLLTGRRWSTWAWVICHLAFKGRRRSLMQPGRYTELFFLDEATALAAGHRPCGECRWAAYSAFKALWWEANAGRFVQEARATAGVGGGSDAAGAGRAPLAAWGSIKLLDRLLHMERRVRFKDEALPLAQLGELPQGTFVVQPGEQHPWLVQDSGLWRWTPAGYQGPLVRVHSTRVGQLTPPSVVQVFRAGWRPQIHPSAEP